MIRALIAVIFVACIWGAFVAGQVSVRFTKTPLKDWANYVLGYRGDPVTVSASLFCVPEGVKTTHICMFFPAHSGLEGVPRPSLGWFLHPKSLANAKENLGNCLEEFLQFEQVAENAPRNFFCTVKA